MRPISRSALCLILAGCCSTTSLAQDGQRRPGANDGGGATTVYRQIMPDGRVVYTDKAEKGARVDRTITVDPAIKGNSWSAHPVSRPVHAPLADRTPIDRVNPPPGMKKRTLDEASSNVIRAEMLLEDARRRQEAGVEPLPGERTGNANGGSRLNETYQARQQALERDVIEAELVLRRARVERDSLSSAR